MSRKKKKKEEEEESKKERGKGKWEGNGIDRKGEVVVGRHHHHRGICEKSGFPFPSFLFFFSSFSNAWVGRCSMEIG